VITLLTALSSVPGGARNAVVVVVVDVVVDVDEERALDAFLAFLTYIANPRNPSRGKSVERVPPRARLIPGCTRHDEANVRGIIEEDVILSPFSGLNLS